LKHNKIKTPKLLIKEREFLAECDKFGFKTPIVFVNGCFDLFHAGHAQLLNVAKLFGGVNSKLIVAVNSDSSVKALKGHSRPIIGQNERAYIVASQQAVDYVFIFNEKTVSKYLKSLFPDFWFKGGEYSLDKLHPLERRNMGNCILKPLTLTCDQSSTKIISKCRKKYTLTSTEPSVQTRKVNTKRPNRSKKG
jgi:rfaE bifunctional protein nucleotidyltransferase chain/domain